MDSDLQPVLKMIYQPEWNLVAGQCDASMLRLSTGSIPFRQQFDILKWSTTLPKDVFSLRLLHAIGITLHHWLFVGMPITGDKEFDRSKRRCQLPKT